MFLNFDINKTREILNLIQPYLKYLAILMYFLQLFVVAWVLSRDSKLRSWIMASFEEVRGQGASGKSLSAFLLIQIVSFASFMAVLYSPNHILPEYFLISLLTFVGSLYGIKVASKYFSGGGGDSSAQNLTGNLNAPEQKPNSDSDNQVQPDSDKDAKEQK